METCSGAQHIARRLEALGHDAKLIPAQYVKPFLNGHKNDYRDAEAIAEAVQRPTMRFVRIKTPEQLDLLALHDVRSRLVRQRTGVINQIRGFLIERGITVRKGPGALRKALPEILNVNDHILSPRVIRIIEGLCEEWRGLDTRIEAITDEIELLANMDMGCQRCQASVQPFPVPSLPRSETDLDFPAAATLVLGSAWCRVRFRLEIERSWGA